ncbi:hypothetical protein [Uliginosibacterium aquaticum]|uniref:Lipoprotein n=1 Tax=Uliginosibacterium aquaticum TaxID=2731212 RepID=A0ABX2IAV3_9RHOO|nr:hypothetical protein [Uliginosibacterium aquaticum]NSL53459.1 hypothetical protein [Uliginosibacterium aquaticum]
MRHYLSLALLCLTLAACGAKILRADGPYLQVGPTDAPLNELTLPDKEHCEYLIGIFGNQPVRCTAESIKLPFAGKVRNDFWKLSIPVTGRTLTACSETLSRIGKSKGWDIEEACVQVGEPIAATAASVDMDKPASRSTRSPKKQTPAAQSGQAATP